MHYNPHITRISDTVEFLPSVVPFTNTSTEDYMCQSVGDIISLLNDPKLQAPFLMFYDYTSNAIREISTVIHRALP